MNSMACVCRLILHVQGDNKALKWSKNRRDVFINQKTKVWKVHKYISGQWRKTKFHQRQKLKRPGMEQRRRKRKRESLRCRSWGVSYRHWSNSKGTSAMLFMKSSEYQCFLWPSLVLHSCYIQSLLTHLWLYEQKTMNLSLTCYLRDYQWCVKAMIKAC